MVLIENRNHRDYLWIEVRKFLDKNLFTDLVIRTSDGFDVFAHKIVFAAASPALRRALPEQAHDDVCYLILPDFSKQAVLEFLPFLYGVAGPDGIRRKFPQDLLKCLNVEILEGGNFKEEKSKRRKHSPKSSKSTKRLKKLRESVVINELSENELHTLSPESINDVVIDDEETFESEEILIPKAFQCQFCLRQFKLEKVFQKHIFKHQDPLNKVYKCNLCSKSFKARSTLHYHVQKHKNPCLKCSECDKTFKSLKGLSQHGIIHSGNVTDHQCTDCGKSFVTKQKLLNHRRSVHTFEKPYICDQCGQGFTRSDKMVVHKRRAHTGEKPFKCEKCAWRGVDSSALIHHRKKHLVTLSENIRETLNCDSPPMQEYGLLQDLADFEAFQ